MQRKKSHQTPLTGEIFDSLSDAEKEAVYQECEQIGPNDGEPLSPELKARWRNAIAKGRPKVGDGAARVQITVERNLLRKADAYAKRHGISRSKLIAHGLTRLLKAG